MRALDFYINETKNKLYIKNKDYLALASDPFKFLVDLYEDKINVKGDRTEKKLEVVEAFFISVFVERDYDPSDKKDSKTYNDLKKAFKYMFDKYRNKESAIMLDSLFYKYRNQIPDFFDNDTLDILNKFDDQLFVKVRILYDRLMSGRTITSFDEDLFYTYLKNHIDDNDITKEICANCFQMLLEEEKRLTKPELSFVIEYMTYKDWDLECERPYVYVTDFNNDTTYGQSLSDYNTIFISSRFIGEPIMDHEVIFDYHEESYYTLSQTLYHEIQHQRQGEYSKNKYITLTTFQYACRKLIPQVFGKKFDEYKENYMYKEIETQANLIGAHKSYLLAEEYNLEAKEYHKIARKDYAKKFSKSVHIDEFGIASDVVNFNINNLREIVGNNPKVLKTYPVLGTIFTKEGELKSFNEFIKDYADLIQNKESESVNRLYNYLFKYYLYNSRDLGIDLFDIEFDTFNEKLTYLIMLEDYIINELTSLINIFDTINKYDLKNEDDLKSILYDKTDKLVEAYAIVKKHKVLDLINLVLPSLDNNLDTSKKIKKIVRVFIQIKECNLSEHVKGNPLISEDPEMYAIARRIDAIDKSLARVDRRRKVIKSRNKQPDYIGQIKR